MTDHYTLFYFQFLKNQPTDEHFWTINTDSPMRNTWCGLAFERICLDHVAQIKAKLGITGVLTEVHAWASRPDAKKSVKGAQIDLVIARKDRIINLCEMKYSINKYSFTKKDDESLRNKIVAIKNSTKTNYSIHPVLITTYGLTDGMYSGSIQSVITTDDLFTRV